MNKVFRISEEAAVSTFALLFAILLITPGTIGVQTVFAQVSTSTNQTINLTVNQTITLTLSSTTLNLSSLTPGVPVSATSSATVSTNAATGWNLKVNRVSAPSTLASSSITFPDFTSWNGSNSTTTDLIGANLHFRVMQTGTAAGLYSSIFWGSSDTDGAAGAKYGGFPTTAQTIASTSTYGGTAQVVIMKIRADAPATQQATNYTGQVTVTAITNP
ncbi:MAG: hypothetical protein WCW78_02015 [Candidatus Paceibacterota bacterium]|jgi:hypothetical protein